jgi:RNA polymerase sigma-70 factor (ECF subfamily)
MAGSRVYMGVTGEAIEIHAIGQAEANVGTERLAVLFDTHNARLYVLARRLMPTIDDAKDLVQETFLRVARKPESVPTGLRAEEAWLVRVLVNVCRDQWRKRASHRRLSALLHPGGDRGTSTRSAEAQVIAHDAIWHALSRLSPRRRAALILCELDGRDIPDIAARLGVSKVTIRWHLSRGRRELARIIEGGRNGTP